MTQPHDTTVVSPKSADRQLKEALVDAITKLTAAVDRSTAAIYDTAKAQPINDQFVEQIEKAMRFIDTYAKDTAAPSTGQSIANKLKYHLMDYRRAQ